MVPFTEAIFTYVRRDALPPHDVLHRAMVAGGLWILGSPFVLIKGLRPYAWRAIVPMAIGYTNAILWFTEQSDFNGFFCGTLSLAIVAAAFVVGEPVLLAIVFAPFLVVETLDIFAHRHDPSIGLVIVVLLIAQTLAAVVATVAHITKTRELRQEAIAEILQEAEVRRLRTVDDVTGLPNVAAINEYLDQHPKDENTGLILVDLDRPDLLAARIGDAGVDGVLSVAARRLGALVPSGATLFRFRGTSFAIVLVSPTSAILSSMAEEALKIFATPFQEVTARAFVDATVVFGATPGEATTLSDLIHHCEAQLVHVRREHQAEDPPTQLDIARRRVLADDLPHALAKSEMVLYFQPCVSAVTGATESVEALIRWEHAEYGTLAPIEFIPLAESEGLIVPLGAWVMQSAADAARRWSKNGTSYRVAFNVSARQFRDPTFCDRLTHAISTSGVDPHLLTLEVTESTATFSTTQAASVLHTCAGLGIEIALDDFGTGYSSLAKLKHLEIDTIKIDKSFVEGLPTDADDIAIVNTIIALARALDCRTHAEGVETQEQFDWLVKAGCDVLQGYFIARPMSFDAIEKWSATRTTPA